MEKNRKKLMVQKSCIAGRWKNEQNQIYGELPATVGVQL